jgi:FAD synthetase
MPAMSLKSIDVERVNALVQQPTPLANLVTQSLDIITSALHTYGPRHIALSFNGGKDCTVLLHLYYTALVRHLGRVPCPEECKAIYIVSKGDTFPEVDEFVTDCVSRYGLQLRRVCGSVKDALGQYMRDEPEVHAVLLGNRSSDPYSHTLQPFQMTDEGWPQLMRVHAILQWGYHDVWTFIRTEAKIEYCVLYERGFTSLGAVHNTQPNPLLRDDTVKFGYRAAWSLTDESTERSGRLKG